MILFSGDSFTQEVGDWVKLGPAHLDSIAPFQLPKHPPLPQMVWRSPDVSVWELR